MNRSDNVSSLLDEATKHMNAGKFGRAFTLLKNLLATDPTHQEGRRLLATLLLKLGNPATAKNAFDSLLQQAFKHHNYVEAESLLKEYLSVGPRCAPFIEMLGEVYERKGDPIAAVFEYEKAIKILLEDPEPEGASHARELYEKIKALAPHSFVAGRLTEKFDAISLPPSDARPAASPSFPLPPSVSPELPPIAMLVSDSIEVPAPPPPTKGIADHQGSSILQDPPASADSTQSSPDIAQTTGSEEPVASGEPDVPPSQLSATVKAAPPDAFPPDAQEVLEKVPFPPVN